MPQPPSEPAPQISGYLVVLSPEAACEAFRQELERLHPGRVPVWEHLTLAEMPEVAPKRYAGWDRDPIGRAWSEERRSSWPAHRTALIGLGVDPCALPEQVGDLWSRAAHLMTARLGDDPNLTWDVRFVSPAVIPDLALAQEVLAATDAPTCREIIHLTRLESARGEVDGDLCSGSPTAQTLGFDVGTWGGPFSLISDTMLYPRWHPAPEEALPTLRTHARRLNQHTLFPDAAAAMAFRAWYCAQEWAERVDRDEEYSIARVALV